MIQGIYLNIIKANYKRPVPNIKLNGEKFKEILLRPRRRLNCSFSQYHFNTVLKVLTREIRQQKKIKELQLGKKKSQRIIIYDDMKVFT